MFCFVFFSDLGCLLGFLEGGLGFGGRFSVSGV